MADYQKMYSQLFNKITDVIIELQQIQEQTEELYIQSEESETRRAQRARPVIDENSMD